MIKIENYYLDLAKEDFRRLFERSMGEIKAFEAEREFDLGNDSINYEHFKLLYELDFVTIDLKPPSSGAETPNEFVSWCMEDQQLREKIEFKMVVSATAEDVTFARNMIDTLQQFHKDITLQPLYWSESEAKKEADIGQTIQNLRLYEEAFSQPSTWKSYAEFASEFMDTVHYENVRILPQLHKIYWPGKLSGI